MKVFEFAKEIGVETITLMDKIREWKLPIKSHMASLDDELITQIRTKLAEETASSAAKKKTKVSKAKKASEEKAPAAEAAVKKTVKATTKSTSVEKPVVKAAAPTVAKATTKVKAAVKTTKAVKATAVETAISEEAAPATEAPKLAPKKSGTVIRRKAGEPVVTLGTTPVAVEAQQEETTVAGSNSPISAEAAVTGAPDNQKRKNIVGKMDLSRAKPPAGAAASPDSRMRAPATGARNIRTGFFAQPAPVFDQQNESFEQAEERKRLEEKKRRPARGEEEVQSFIAADFRKREVIFQPKKKKVSVSRDVKKTQITMPKASKRVIRVEKSMSLGELALTMGIKAPLLVKKLMADGVMANMNTQLDFETIALVVPEFNFEAENVYKTPEEMVKEAAFGDLKADPVKRPPVVAVMGHVDHGKTSLLDAIRKADVASGEAGGITQHIGAYKVSIDDDKTITFLDTPGHEAFTQMRARGANVTDIAIIVVAADDGVMPQTSEAISHAKAAGVPIIIAVNKIDKPGANVDKIKQQLTEFEIVPEEWGGTHIFCEVSALKKTGIKELLEQILLVAEVEDYRANPARSGVGNVIEARLEKGRGVVATLLVKDGTVRIGDNIAAGQVAGRVRAMTNYKGEAVKEALPGDPVEIIGLSEVPAAGDSFNILEDEDTARTVALARKAEAHKVQATGKDALTLEELFAKVQKGQIQELNVVLKADVSGSIEALKGMLEKAATSEVKVKVIHSNIGGISESDVLLASTSGGLVLGFNVRPDTSAMRTAKERNVEIKTYTIIYELLDDVKKAMAGLLKPITREVVNGRAEVREVFPVPKLGNIAGCSVVDGKITRSDSCRLIRNGTIVFQGKFASLRRFKDDVREVASGFECGIGIENFNDIKVGDVIESFIIEQVAQTL